jgi:AcrR family transcriptional regulator
MPQISATREVARSAVRAELASVALHQFLSHGFEQVTVSDLALAAGVSRSTFLRYFDTKEDAVLGALDPKGELIANALRERPGSEHIWAALRRSLDPLIDEYRQDPAGALNLARLVGQSTALRSGHLDKQRRWRGLLAVAIAERLGVDEATDLRPAVYATATLEALQIATDRWVASDGQLDLIALVDEATGLLTPASRRRTARQSVESGRARTSPPH